MRKGHGLNIEHHNCNTPLLEHLYNGAPYPPSAARHEHNLLFPVIPVAGPVVAYAIGEPRADPAGEGEVEEVMEATGGGGVQDGGVLALLGEAGQEDEGQEEGRVEGRLADYGQDAVCREALAGDEAFVERHIWDF